MTDEQDDVTGARVLVVEDDHRFASLVCELLRNDGFMVDRVADGETAVERILSDNPDLVLLDVMLPGIDGLAVCKRVRPWYVGAIVMLTALGEDQDQMRGLGVGADDFLLKTTAARLLCARMRSLLRRVRRQEALPNGSGLLDLGWLISDPQTRTVMIHGKPINLTSAEFDLLHFLAGRAGKVVTREQIARELDHAAAFNPRERAIDLRISRLRRKLGDEMVAMQRLKSVRGSGYLMVCRDPAGGRP